jgi:hypothetical protein
VHLSTGPWEGVVCSSGTLGTPDGTHATSIARRPISPADEHAAPDAQSGCQRLGQQLDCSRQRADHMRGRDALGGRDASATSCHAARDHFEGTDLILVAGEPVLCDTLTDGGGWTLIASGRAPPSDYGGSWYRDLTTLRPEGAGGHLWYAEPLDAPKSDIRFSCAAHRCESPTSCGFAVDFVMYSNPLYRWLARTKVTEYVPR